MSIPIVSSGYHFGKFNSAPNINLFDLNALKTRTPNPATFVSNVIRGFFISRISQGY